eukprot:TRINITY_DN5460_c0_g1_i2.p1 TRINITY_DN5460_c0_g1~~TRINITY_DN5460_c0_g1_i2.p1  ORF type:complete len:407 (-),score=69.89 TRINITY_DN5460_c0_g1_i2:119-1339(-)
MKEYRQQSQRSYQPINAPPSGIDITRDGQYLNVPRESDESDINDLPLQEKKGSHFSRFFQKIDFLILFWVLVAIGGNIFMVVFLVRVGVAIPQYSYFLLNFGCLVFTVPFAVVCIVNHLIYKTVEPEMTTLRIKAHLFGQGFLIAANGICIVFGNPHVSGPLQTLLLQGNIPAGMIACLIFLGTRYKWNHYVGVTIVCIGVQVAVVGSYLWPEEGSQAAFSLLWVGIYFLGNIPSALSTVYQEFVFRSQRMDLSYLMLWSNIFQWISLIILAPMNLIPNFGNASSVSDIWTQYYAGFQCLLGHSTDDNPDEQCDDLMFYFAGFVLGYVVSNFASAALVKYGNSLFSILVTIASTIIANLAFSFKWLFGPYIEPANPFDWGALVFILVGIIFYRYRKPSYVNQAAKV